MIEVVLKANPTRSSWYVTNEVYYVNAEVVSTGRRVLRPHIWRPPTDVYETDEAVVVRVEIAGMRQNDFSISLDGQSLVVRGTRSDVFERRLYHQMEIRFGEFNSEVELTIPVAIDQSQADYKDGFLYVILPKTQPE